ncbi:hypothetical protein MKZ38_004418 [Zalerion maritima]|uniref:Ecp2 effector protein-like domain-containing protein n=1 Tax=Zalerion maritima TaxID=339359 RepID=A0AAD5RSF5_9PEZI|nr:hypothetical protein MKZ38_004418 [Zalerion maritima]
MCGKPVWRRVLVGMGLAKHFATQTTLDGTTMIGMHDYHQHAFLNSQNETGVVKMAGEGFSSEGVCHLTNDNPMDKCKLGHVHEQPHNPNQPLKEDCEELAKFVKQSPALCEPGRKDFNLDFAKPGMLLLAAYRSCAFGVTWDNSFPGGELGDNQAIQIGNLDMGEMVQEAMGTSTWTDDKGVGRVAAVGDMICNEDIRPGWGVFTAQTKPVKGGDAPPTPSKSEL